MSIRRTNRAYLVSLGLGMSVMCAAGAGLPKTNLITFLSNWREPTGTVKYAQFELNPRWVGTVDHAVGRPDDGNDIQFSHLLISESWQSRLGTNSKPQILLVRGRIGQNGRLWSSRDATWKTNLPSVKAISEAKTLTDLEKLLGPATGLPLGFARGWTLFTVENGERLRYLGIFAHFDVNGSWESATARSIRVSEGWFRPADSYSPTELVRFKTEDEISREREMKQAEARAKFPQPLRSLLEAKETPDDSDLNAYKHALNRLRADPNPELFRQLIEAMEQDSVRFHSFLEHILLDERLKLEPWIPERKKMAVRAFADAIPYARSSYALQHALILFLRMQGGGKFTIPGSSDPTEVVLRGNGYGTRHGGTELKTSVAEAAAECHRQIKRECSDVWVD